MSGPPHNPYYNEEQKRKTFFKRPSTRFIQFNAKNPKGKYVFEHVQDIHTTHASNQQSQPRNVQIETKNEPKPKPKNEETKSEPTPPPLPNEQPEPPPKNEEIKQNDDEPKQNSIKLNPSNEVYEEPASESTVSESFTRPLRGSSEARDTSQQRPRSHSVSFDPSVTKKFHRHHHHRTQSQAREYPPDPQTQNQNETPNTKTPPINETIKTEQPAITPDVDINELKADLKIALTPIINSYIDSKIRYNIEQRLGLMFNNDELTTRGSSSFSISSDAQNTGKSFMFNVNGEPVAKITEDGRLYCKSLSVGGVSIIDLLNDINTNFDIIGNDFVTNAQLKDGTYELDVSSIISNLAQLNTVEVGTINDCVIAPTNSSVTPTVSFIPVVKSGDSALSIGKRLDFHDVLGDNLDYRVRLEAQSDGALRLYNYNATNHPLQIISNNSQTVQLQLGRNPSQNYMGIIQFNYAASEGSTLGFGMWNYNNVVTINKYGIITANGGMNAFGDITTNNGILGAFVNTTGNHQFVKCGYDFNGRNYIFLAHNFSSDDSALNSASVGLNNGSYIRFGASDMSLYGSLSVDSTIYQLKDSLSANQSIFHYIGRVIAESGRIGYNLKSPLTDSYMNFAVNGTETLKMLNNLVESLQNFKCPNLEVSTNASVGGVLTVNGELDATASVNVNWDVQVGHNLVVANTATIDSFDSTTKQMILRLMYPVGSVYMSATSHDNPNVIFGVNVGTWTEITNDRFLLSSDSSKNLREEGGSFSHNHTTSNHVLTVDEMPSHNHYVRGSYNSVVYGNSESCIGLAKWGDYASYENVNSQGYGYIGLTGGGQAHNHGDTGMTVTQQPYYRVHAWYRSA